MNWVVVTAAVLSLWSALRLLGNERQRRVDSVAASAPAAAPAESAPVAG